MSPVQGMYDTEPGDTPGPTQHNNVSIQASSVVVESAGKKVTVPSMEQYLDLKTKLAQAEKQNRMLQTEVDRVKRLFGKLEKEVNDLSNKFEAYRDRFN